jgi:hypothetical protein
LRDIGDGFESLLAVAVKSNIVWSVIQCGLVEEKFFLLGYIPI